MNKSRVMAQVGSTTCGQEGIPRLESSLSKLAINVFAIYKFIDHKATLVRQQIIHQKLETVKLPSSLQNEIAIGVSIVGQAAQLRKKISYTEECYKAKMKNGVDQSFTEIALPIYNSDKFYGILYVVSEDCTDSFQQQLYDVLVCKNLLPRIKSKPINQLKLVSSHNQSDEQLKTAQKVFYNMLKKMHCQLEFDQLLDQFNKVLQVDLGSIEFNRILKFLVRIYIDNEKMKVFGMVLSQTFLNPVANNQMAVADSLFMAYSTYRRHLCNSKKMLYYEFLKQI